MTILSAFVLALITFPVALGFIWIFVGLGVSVAASCGIIGYRAMSVFKEDGPEQSDARVEFPNSKGAEETRLHSRKKRPRDWDWNQTQPAAM